MLWASPAGAVTVLLRRRVTVDIGIDHSIRVCLPGIMAVGLRCNLFGYVHSSAQMTATGDGERAALIHPDMRVYQTADRIYAQVR